MGCMKCGRDIQEGQVFCADCLETMERYPVKTNTPVILPKRRPPNTSRRSAPRRKTLSPEDQIRRLRKLNRTLSFLLALALVLAIFFGYVSLLHFMEEERVLPGQNYSSIETLPG